MGTNKCKLSEAAHPRNANSIRFTKRAHLHEAYDNKMAAHLY